VADRFRLFGAELSPYSVKVRSALRAKQLAFDWLVRDQQHMPEYQRLAKLPLIPLLVRPSGEVLQDSTPILEWLEANYPKPSFHPSDARLRFLSELLEEFGDEWGNKWMFHIRWAARADQDSAAARLVDEMNQGLAPDARAKAIEGLRQRMTGRVWFVGSSPENAPVIEESFRAAARLLETHLASRPYLFGARPAFADFGLAPQLYELWTDPTPKTWLEANAPRVVAYAKRMLDPSADGEFERFEALVPTLRLLLLGQVGALFLPWSDANARAIAANAETFEVSLAGHRWRQKPQKYHARSLAELRRKYQVAAGNADLDALLRETGCLAWLSA
jgi:glutathione S-transferase